ncbi:MAG: hypothetical protein QXF12_02705 [Candidatus Aenigmatarchaeota archaeon]
MGRPINKKYFGNPSNPGNQIKVNADLGSGVVSAWIKKQKGTRKFLVTNGIEERICFLVDNITQPGQATIDVIKDSGPNERVRTLQAKRVKTWNNNDYVWGFGPPSPNKVKIDNS